jgi:tetratricopeptide (TPR) repeat protein
LQRIAPSGWRRVAAQEIADSDDPQSDLVIVPREPAESEPEEDASPSPSDDACPEAASPDTNVDAESETAETPAAPEPDEQIVADDAIHDAATESGHRAASESGVELRVRGEQAPVETDAAETDAAETETAETDPVEPEQQGSTERHDAKTTAADEPLPPRSDLPWAKAQPRSPEMLAVVQRADGRVRRGFQLAEHGALYTARAEFVAALGLISQANDAQQGTRMYSKALTAGLIALKESSDFAVPTAGRPELDMNRLIGEHKTPILKSADPERLSPMFAAQRYYTYAQEQLSASAAQQGTGSMALFGLAKVAIAMAGNDKSQQLERTAQAIALYQAAMMADSRNFLAANELAVLFAENGNLPRSRELLTHSISLSPRAVTWQNLAVVYARLGERKLAEDARAQALALQQGGQPSEKGVKWVDPDTFARMAPLSDTSLPAVAPVKVGVQPSVPSAEMAKKGINDWLPWNSRR